jgi:hypothetical protein
MIPPANKGVHQNGGKALKVPRKVIQLVATPRKPNMTKAETATTALVQSVSKARCFLGSVIDSAITCLSTLAGVFP